MPGRAATRATIAAALVLVMAAPGPAHGDGELTATRTLVARLKAAGRGEATITVTLVDPMGGPDRVQRGRIALEPPDRLRLDFPATGERVALRGDGGEWIQPEARQMVRIEREQAGLAAWLWDILLTGGTSGFSERKLAERRLVLEPLDRGAGLPDSITVALDAHRLPAGIDLVESGGGATRYRFSGWRFVRARGPAAFRLTAPRGFAVVDLP